MSLDVQIEFSFCMAPWLVQLYAWCHFHCGGDFWNHTLIKVDEVFDWSRDLPFIWMLSWILVLKRTWTTVLLSFIVRPNFLLKVSASETRNRMSLFLPGVQNRLQNEDCWCNVFVLSHQSARLGSQVPQPDPGWCQRVGGTVYIPAYSCCGSEPWVAFPINSYSALGNTIESSKEIYCFWWVAKVSHGLPETLLPDRV